MHRAALQMLRDDMPPLFQGVHSLWGSTWQDNMVLMSRIVRDATRMVRAASSGYELDVSSAKLAGIDVIFLNLSVLWVPTNLTWMSHQPSWLE